jgi:hypothetical protein
MKQNQPQIPLIVLFFYFALVTPSILWLLNRLFHKPHDTEFYIASGLASGVVMTLVEMYRRKLPTWARKGAVRASWREIETLERLPD